MVLTFGARIFAALVAVAATTPMLALAAQSPRVLDDFSSVAGWTAHPSDGTELRISSDSGFRGRGMRLDFDFRGGGGYVIARKEIPIRFPENYEITFRIRGPAPTNNLEFKLVDASGDNVWWVNRRNFEFTMAWSQVTLRKRHISFAWGPSGGGELRESAAIEIAITAGTGGKGTVWIDDLILQPREPVTEYTGAPVARATSAVGGNTARNAIDGDTSTTWRSHPAAGPVRAGRQASTLSVDFLQIREIGGLTIHWGLEDYATSYEVQTSLDGRTWRTAYGGDGNGGLDHISLPEVETRHIRLRLSRSSRGRGYEIAEIEVHPIEWSATPNDFFTAVARDAPRGSYPKYLGGVQSYWTIIGVSGDSREAMINEEGMIETGKAQFSIEPFLYLNDSLLTWNDVTVTQSLERGDIPIPSVRWDAGVVGMNVTAFATGNPGASTLHARYQVENRTTNSQRATLYLALRPFQVNPTWQFLNTSGGVAEIRSLRYDRRAVRVNEERVVIPVTAPEGFGAATFGQGNIVEFLRRGELPGSASATDGIAHASGALSYPLDLSPGETREIHLAIPLHDTTLTAPTHVTEAEARAWGTARFAEAVRSWSGHLDNVGIQLPPSAERVARVIRSTLGYILINRDGPSIQPGSRSYERSWIRDGALTSAALLRLGHFREVREFIEWYAPFQYDNGKVPCCVDSRGADPVPEHDSHGQLIYLIAEYHRFTRDTAFLARHWSHVAGAVAYIDSLRAQRMTEEYRIGEKRAYYGLVPESISHEGYSAKPMHSYWDDAFVLRGLKDAAEIAGILGKRDTVALFAAKRDEFRGSMMDSYRLAMAMHGIDYLPGSVELGDFDATSTTVGVAPGGEILTLPQPALNRTFQKYLENFRGRREGTVESDAYTPYELRTVGTFVRLGQKAVAHELLDFFFRDIRPPAWNHWAEVVWADPAAPKFIGDMPHTWVGSDYIRSVTDMLAYEREDDDALVIGAGVIEPWVIESPGVTVRNLATHHGPLSYTMSGTPQEVRVRISGALRIPAGGIAIQSPIARRMASATVNGAVAAINGAEIIVRDLPAEVVIRY